MEWSQIDDDNLAGLRHLSVVYLGWLLTVRKKHHSNQEKIIPKLHVLKLPESNVHGLLSKKHVLLHLCLPGNGMEHINL